MLTPADIRSRFETDLEDATLQALIDAETEAVNEAAGAANVKATHFAGGLRFLILSRPVDQITKVEERRTLHSDLVELSAEDYRQVDDYHLLRLSSGTHGLHTWGQEVHVTYTAKTNQKLRDRIITDLVQLDVEFRALDSESTEGWSGSQKDYKDRRLAIMAQLQEGEISVV